MEIFSFSELLKEAFEEKDKDLLYMGIQEEKTAVKLYENAAAKTSNKKVKDLFLHIAKEEKEHQREFQELLDEL